MPAAKVFSRLAAANSSKGNDGACHVATHRSTAAARSTRQSAPYSQSKASQIALSIRGAASASVDGFRERARRLVQHALLGRVHQSADR